MILRILSIIVLINIAATGLIILSGLTAKDWPIFQHIMHFVVFTAYLSILVIVFLMIKAVG